ncbi:hypothetical protein LIER_37767 [Lithospermum erythrorhizon]|uniref:Uncharacterized protein n=1 Tax=Lithospermum erythrorhizon TaxID=34254 RepID=A0AAV3PVH6_LITER
MLYKLGLPGWKVRTLTAEGWRLQLLNNHTTKKVGELEKKAKAAEEALPLSIQEAITDYQQSEEFCLEAGKEATYCLCRFIKNYRDVNP